VKGWYLEEGPNNDVVISSRVRLARNINDYPFPIKMTPSQGKYVIDRVKAVLLNNRTFEKENLSFFDMKEIDTIEKQALVEEHLISPELAEKQTDCGAIISNNENISIMINEEDHLRIQSLLPGMQIDKSGEICAKIDEVLEKKIEFAFSSNYGYLSCCPTNIGTGMRASFMLHLPALTLTGHIRSILEACGKLGVAVRGLYGEHSEAIGNMFQISNQVTLGQSEQEILAGITNIASQVIEQERTVRNDLYRQNSLRIEDRIFRSFGVLSGARIISAEESLKLLSDVRLGVSMGIIKNISMKVLNEVMIIIQPALLQKRAGSSLSSDERDTKRAEIIRDKLGRME
jgi:protein arginine kinase